MGLDFSHGEAHWSYSGFMHFRNEITKHLGYTKTLSEMYDDGTYDVMQNEPIWPLINHSDCDGDLTVKEMKQIIPQLREILLVWEKATPDQTGFYETNRTKAFIESMEVAIEENEPLEFT